jgi:hypothetical protein
MKTKTNLIFLMVIGVMIIGALAFVPAKVMAQSNEDTGGVYGPVEPGTAAEPLEVASKLYAYLVKPCRVVDTRIIGGYFYPGQSREYYVYGPYFGSTGIQQQGGYSGGCFPPPGYGEPYGVILNMTAIPYAGYGNFKVYPANVSPPSASFVNYRYGVQNIANAGSVETYYNSGPREIEVYNENGYSYLVIDIMGYYYKN